MKSILSGVVVSRYLSFRTYLAKVCGLVAALNSGLFIGKEGPYVHISSIYANQLLKRVPWFEEMNKNDGLRQQLLGAACAVGVSTSFGSTVGGVIFSIEVRKKKSNNKQKKKRKINLKFKINILTEFFFLPENRSHQVFTL